MIGVERGSLFIPPLLGFVTLIENRAQSLASRIDRHAQRMKDAEEVATLALMDCATTPTHAKDAEQEDAALALMACTATNTCMKVNTCTKVTEEGATLALMALTSAANRAQQCKLHEVQVLLALHTENRTVLPVQQHVATISPVPVRNFWSAATSIGTGTGAVKSVRLVLRAPGVPARTHALPLPLSASADPSLKRRAESTLSGASSSGKKVCQWKGTVLLNEQYLRLHAPAAPLLPTAAPAAAPAPAIAAPSKKAVRCKWRTTQQIVPICSSRWVHVAI